MSETMKPKSFAAHVWGTLSRVDVTDFIETKGNMNLSYMSWSWCWSQLMKYFPESSFVLLDEEKFDDGTVSVRIIITVRETTGAGTEESVESLERFMWLPVLSHNNQPISNPSSLQVSNSRMRCIVKAIATLGLGIDLYSGSDLPVGTLDDPIDKLQLEMIQGLLEKSEADVSKFCEWLGVETVEQIPAGKYKQARVQLENKLRAKK